MAIFPHTSDKKKNFIGSEALNEDNLVCKSIRYIKDRYKNQIGIMTDVALDPYTSHGHDGILENNYVNNDKTVEILCKQSLLQAQMGCDIIAPSDMMDGRIGAIRKSLDRNNYKDVQILSYSAKYASSFYGPFRNAIGSSQKKKINKNQKVLICLKINLIYFWIIPTLLTFIFWPGALIKISIFKDFIIQPINSRVKILSSPLKI